MLLFIFLMVKFIIRNFINSVDIYQYPLLELKLSENSGTTAYDTSGNGNNGTISGATWNNDGILITLTNLVDYTLSANIFTIINSALAWDEVALSYDYLTQIESSSTTIIRLVQVLIAVTILSFILIIINYYTKDFFE